MTEGLVKSGTIVIFVKSETTTETYEIIEEKLRKLFEEEHLSHWQRFK